MTETRIRWWRPALAALAVVAFGASCSSSDDATTATTDATTTSTTAVADTEASFAVPEERLREVEAAGLTFAPMEYATAPDDVPWPTEQWPTGELPEGVDPAEVEAIVERAFGELSTDGETIDAIVVAKDGRLVVEEYNDWDPAATHMSWSVAKSINSALIGILVGQGELDIWEPVDAPEWQEPDDPRAAITLDHLLRMSSGLEWSESYEDPDGDVLTTLGTGADRAGYTASKPLAQDPDTTWYYSTGTANLIGRSVAQQVGFDTELTDWMDEALFEPLGITQVEHSLDATGLHSGGSWINLTPQDFARFGLLYARGGIWDGQRILPEGWVDYSRMPTPTNPEGTYGAQWWLEPDHPGLLYASGFNGQSINVFPEEDLVIVVLSETPQARDEEVREALFDAFGV
jgi:CubicO group peptidase (beta-lactamase class C family)